MFINENGADQWRKMLTENFNVTDQQKLNWVSQYAAIHEIYESQFGVNGGNVIPGANGAFGPIYATPLNTLGMGNVYAPGQLPVGQQPDGTQALDPVNFWKQSVGSGDIPQSTLPMALNVALLTVGLELVPVIPAKGPWQMVSYMDFPYAGGKLGRINETSFDGIGEKNENKPIYVKVKGLTLEQIKGIRDAMVQGKVKAGDDVTVGVFKGKFIDLGRMDACPLAVVEESGNVSLREAFAAATSIKIGTADAIEVEAGTLEPDFVQTSVDLVDGFANFATGAKAPMTRAENETGTGNTIGLRLFTKWIQVGSYEVTGTVTRQQLQDLPLYGVDAQGKIMEAMQNELTQHINQRILERVFALGVTNAAQQKARQGVDLNLYLGQTGAAGKALANFPIKEYKDIYGVDHKASWGTIVNAEALSSAENTSTRQRRISSRILAAAVLIQNVGRRGRASWVITNAKVAAALQDVSGYVVAPMVNNMAQDGSQNLYLGGTIAGLKVYVDPYMDWEDTRICVGRKGDANSPGVIFMPYILADTVTITAEGTMAPKMLINSRYALTEIGFYPQLQYYTFAVNSEFDII